MKKLLKNLFFFGAVGSVAILASCGGDDETVLPDGPSIEVDVTGLEDTTSPYEAMPGETVTLTVNMVAPGKFNVLRVVGMDGDTEVYSEEFARGNASVTANADNTEATVVINIDFTDDNVGQEVDFDFEVVDDNDKKATTTVSITVVAPPSPEARAYSAVLLYAPLGDKSADGFFSSNTGLVYSPTDVTGTAAAVSPNIDFGYYYGTSDNASLASPKAYSTLSNVAFTAQVAGWTKLNETVLKTTTLSASAFAEVTTWADIEEAYEASTDAGSGVRTALAAGQVLAFKTDGTKTGGSKMGLILVKSITAGSDAAGKIELDILVQEDAE